MLKILTTIQCIQIYPGTDQGGGRFWGSEPLFSKFFFFNENIQEKQIFNTSLGSFFSSNYTKYVVNRFLISMEVEFHFQSVISEHFLLMYFFKVQSILSFIYAFILCKHQLITSPLLHMCMWGNRLFEVELTKT